jgi:hypothetical protein
VMSATQSVSVTLTRPAAPTLSSVSMNGSQFGFWISGDVGPDYTILASTDLSLWEPLLTTNSPVMPLFWTDVYSPAVPGRFYKILLGP